MSFHGQTACLVLVEITFYAAISHQRRVVTIFRILSAVFLGSTIVLLKIYSSILI